MTPSKLRHFGILLSVLLVGSVVFSGGALALGDITVNNDNDVQVGVQNAVVNQQQVAVGVNAAGINDGNQEIVNFQLQGASVDQELDQEID